MEMSLVPRLHAKCMFETAAKPSRLAGFCQGAESTARKESGWMSKSSANMWRFCHFDLDMCFAPQPRALFEQLNFQKRSEPNVLLTCWLGNALGATTTCTFEQHNWQECSRTAVLLTFWLRNVLRAKAARTFSQLNFQERSDPDRSAFESLTSKPRFAPQPRALFKQHNFQELRRYILTPRCASRHSRVQFLISRIAPHPPAGALASLLFDRPEPAKHWKNMENKMFRDFSTFSRALIFFLLTLSLSLSSSLPILTTVAAPVHLTSKLPSNNYSITAMTNRQP